MAGPLEREEFWLVGFTEPFTFSAIEGREALKDEERGGGGPVEMRLPFEGGSIDFRTVLVGVPVPEDVPDETLDVNCLVGDLLGDFRLVSFSFIQYWYGTYPQSGNFRSGRRARSINTLSLPHG